MQDDNPTTRRRSKVRRAYRALLRLLPFEFRSEFGDDMEDAFHEERDDIRTRRNGAETVRFWFRTAMDFARTAPRQHWDILRQDLRVGSRLLARNPAFSAAAILTLALGIGGSTGIFSVVHAVVLRPLGFPESERVVSIGWVGEAQTPATAVRPVSYTDFQTLRETCKSFDLIGIRRYDGLSSEKGPLRLERTIAGDAGPIQAFVGPLMVSASIFRVFGASTVLGRLPDEGDEAPGASPVVVLSHSTWTSLYGRDPSVIGRVLTRALDTGGRKPVTIIGVFAPNAFDYPTGPIEVPAWSSIDPDVLRRRDDSGRELFTLNLFGRLAPGATIDGARAEMASLTPHLSQNLPTFLATTKPSLRAIQLRQQIAGRVRAPLLAFLAAVGCLLLLASVNVASLVLARALSRRQEFSARFALGARPLRVARQLLTESALLAFCGGGLGLGLAWAARRAFVAISPSMPRLDDSDIGAPALLFALAGVLLATTVMAIIPAVQSSRQGVMEGLRRAGGASSATPLLSRPLAVLAGAEVALVLALLSGTGLLVNSFARLVSFDLGFDSRSTLVVTMERTTKAAAPAAPSAPATAPRSTAALSDRQQWLTSIDEQVIDRVLSIPGVMTAGITGDDPFGTPYRYEVDLTIGAPAQPVTAALRLAGPTALQALRMRMTAGRWFESGDRDGAPFVAVVNESMARRFWSGRSPIGERVVLGRRVLDVVGVVSDVRDRGAREDARSTIYLSTLQLPSDTSMLVVRTHPGMTGVDRRITEELASMADRVTAHSPRWLETIWWRQLADARFLTLVLSVFTAVGLGVALVGVHGVLRFLVTLRSREMGIRKALGATRRDLIGLVIGQALRFAIPGCAAGLVIAFAAGPALRSLLFGITPADPLTMVMATLLLIAAVVAAHKVVTSQFAGRGKFPQPG
jgi:putative ABC transport system permease protein